MIAKTIARIKFIRGPATETIASPVLADIFLVKLFGLICTGFPHPIWAKISIITPNGSKCASGFKLILPWFLGVSSPNLSAAKAWAYSWKVIAIRTPGMVSTKPNISTPPTKNIR